MADELDQEKLHDRTTRGEVLSPEEQERLDAWYAALDQAEAVDLGLEEESGEASLADKIDETLTEIAKITQRIRDLDAETRALRRQNAALRGRLALRLSSQRA